MNAIFHWIIWKIPVWSILTNLLYLFPFEIYIRGQKIQTPKLFNFYSMYTHVYYFNVLQFLTNIGHCEILSPQNLDLIEHKPCMNYQPNDTDSCEPLVLLFTEGHSHRWYHQKAFYWKRVIFRKKWSGTTFDFNKSASWKQEGIVHS